MARRLIGTATTNSQGIATVSYTGEGAGKLQLVAESGNLQSEIYSLTDAIFISTNGLNTSSNTVATNNNGEYSIGLIDTTTYGFLYFSTGTSTSTWIYIEAGNTIEFDVLECTGSTGIRFDGLTNDTIYTITPSKTGHYRIVYNGSTATVYIDDAQTVTVNTSNESKQPRFRIAADSTLKIKNLLYY